MTLFTSLLFSQVNDLTYKQHIKEHQAKYGRDLVRDLHSPIVRYDLNFIHFFETDPNFKVDCIITKLKDQSFVDFPTSSGSKRKYRKFTKLECPINDTIFVLYTYESKRLLESDKYKDYIFLPFGDYTNGETSYGGGRYLDLQRKDFSNKSVTIDFNLCYNPYCAYSTGYSCTVPPVENYMKIEIMAGEKKYTGEKKHRVKH